MRITKALVDALTQGWRNLETCVEEVHAVATVKALRDAGYEIHKVKKTRKPVKASGSKSS